MNQQTILANLRTIGSQRRQQTGVSSRSVSLLPMLALGLWFVAQFCLFNQYLQREVLWAFPGFWDQVRYLQESHDTYQYLVHNGLIRGLIHAVTTPTPNGNLLPTEAAILYLFLGGSRLTALLVLFAHWIVLQVVAVATIRWLSGRWSLAVIGLALLLLAASQFRPEGGLTDFRIDYAAYCTFGILICLVIRSNIFANRRITLLAALVASYMIVLRFITLVYLGAIAGVFLVAVAVLWLARWRQSPISSLARKRLLNLSLALALVFAVCAPVFWHDRHAIYQYYFLGTATEKYIRAREVGIYNTLDSILFYPRAVWDVHAGADFRRTAIALTLLSLLVVGLRRRGGSAAGFSSLRERLDVPLTCLVLSACILGPYLVLTADMTKATYVGNIFMPPLWAMAILAAVCATDSFHGRWLRHVPTAVAVILFTFAVSYQVHAYNKPGRFTQQRDDVKRILELHDLIGQKCQEQGLQSPAIGLDLVSDAFYPLLVGATQRERHQIMLSAYPAFPQAVAAVTEDQVLPGVHRADFVLLTLSGSSPGPSYPFDKSMEAMRPKLLDICDREMLPLRESSFFGRRVRLYMRPSLRVVTTYSDWAGEEGTMLTGDATALRRFQSITLHGATFGNVHFPNGDSTVTATLEIEGHPPLPVPATYADANGQYTIRLSIPPMEPSSEGTATIQLHFHRFFVPKDLGVNDDTRHLVVSPPDSVHLDRQ